MKRAIEPTFAFSVIDNTRGAEPHWDLPCHDLLEIQAEPVYLDKGHIIQDHGPAAPYAFFLQTATVVAELPQTDAALPVLLLGRSDFVGLPAVLDTEWSPLRYVVQSSGHALRVSTVRLKRELATAHSLRRWLLAYAHAVWIESSQWAACGATHSVRERLACTLLALQGRFPRGEIRMTHQTLSRLLGVRRPSVTTVMQEFCASGALSQERGHVEIRNDAELKAEACSCWRAVRAAYTWRTRDARVRSH